MENEQIKVNSEKVIVEEVAKQEENKKEIIAVGIECGRKKSRYPEGNRPHY
jgi:hypothetical protein